MTFQDFQNQWIGKTDVGDTPENIGQCVGLVEKWIDALALPHVWGNAVALLINADKSAYTVIYNNPTNVPSEGDIVVLGKPYGPDGNGGYFGHTGIATRNCDVNKLELFEQNDPTGAAPQVKQYTYEGCLGWLHPNTLSPTANQTMSVEQVVDQLNTQIQATNQCQSQLKTATEQNTTLQQQVKDLTDDKAALQNQIDSLQSTHESDQKEIVSLNGALQTLSGSNKDYASEVLQSEQLVKTLHDYLYAIADKLGINRQGMADNDLTEKALAEIDTLDTLSAAQHQRIQALQKVKLVTPQVVGDIKKNFWQTNFPTFMAFFFEKN